MAPLPPSARTGCKAGLDADGIVAKVFEVFTTRAPTLQPVLGAGQGAIR